MTAIIFAVLGLSLAGSVAWLFHTIGRRIAQPAGKPPEIISIPSPPRSVEDIIEMASGFNESAERYYRRLIVAEYKLDAVRDIAERQWRMEVDDVDNVRKRYVRAEDILEALDEEP